MLSKLKKLLIKQPTQYISEVEKFLNAFDINHPEKSNSQATEIANHERIAYLRDHSTKNTDDNPLWEDF